MRTATARQRGWADIRRGTMAGLVGAVTMTVPILAARRLGFLATPPPLEISANVTRRVPVLPRRGQRGFPAVWLGGHLAYGGACGIAYVAVRRHLPASPVLAGLLFGQAVWATSYLGVIPALGLYPGPEDDSRSRLLVMVGAHGVFGVTVALVSQALERRR